MFCVSANAGTGKTLLIYEIARDLIQANKNPLIVHSGILNNGHLKLQNYGWNILSIRSLNKSSVDNLINVDKTLLIIDEAQRLRDNQINIILNRASDIKLPILFS